MTCHVDGVEMQISIYQMFRNAGSKMAELATWDELVAGTACPLCAPREKYTEYIYFVSKLSASSLYLSRNQHYRGTVSLIYDGPHAVKISQLTTQQWHDFADDMRRVDAAIQQVFKPDHINVESLGNSVPHLHVHFIPRYQSDPRWRHPIWTTERKDMPNVTLSEDAYAQLAHDINQELA